MAKPHTAKPVINKPGGIYGFCGAANDSRYSDLGHSSHWEDVCPLE
jgi:hypothetical protein